MVLRIYDHSDRLLMTFEPLPGPVTCYGQMFNRPLALMFTESGAFSQVVKQKKTYTQFLHELMFKDN